MTEARHTIRNAGALLVQRALHVAGAAAFAALVPRLMGPAVFGRYALLTSVSLWFALLSGIGAASLMTRTLPPLTAAGDTTAIRKLLTNLLALRAVTAIGTAALYYVLIVAWLGEPDRTAAAFVAAGVFCRTIAGVCFAYFLGMNQAARWGAGELLRRWLALVLVVVGFLAAGLRGACLGFLAANVAVLAVGLAWARGSLRWGLLDLTPRYLSPYLRIGLFFGAGNLLVSLVHRSGEAIVRLRVGDFAEVGFFGAAYSVYLTGGQAMWELALACAPFLIMRLHQADAPAVRVWLERLLKWMVIAAMLAALAFVFVGGRLVPFVLGRAFEPVARNLVPLGVALFAATVCSTGRLVALVVDRPGVAALAAVAQLAAFWTVGIVLAGRSGSFGVCVAELVAAIAYAAFITAGTRRALAYSPRAALRAAAPGLVVLPLALLKSTWQVDALLLVAALAGYAALLLGLRIVTIDELRALRAVVRVRPN